MILGHDFLAGAKYPELVLKVKTDFVGIFWDTFGPAKPLILELCAARRVKAIRVQGQWDDDHVFTSDNIPKAISIARELNKIAKDNPHVTFYYSPFCEHRLKKDFMLSVMQRLQPHSSHLILVNAPIKGGDYLEAFVNEVHHTDSPGKPPGDYIFSFDGLHCVDADIEKFKKEHKNALIFAGWVLQYNLKKNHKDKTERPKRKCKPTQKLIKSIRILLERKRQGNLPSRGEIWKSHSEQHHDVDLRANKPVLVTPHKYDRVVLRTVSKRKLIELSYGGRIHDEGRYTWRCSKFGFQIAQEAKKLCGSLVVEVVADGKRIGTLDPSFRFNEYRNQTH